MPSRQTTNQERQHAPFFSVPDCVPLSPVMQSHALIQPPIADMPIATSVSIGTAGSNVLQPLHRNSNTTSHGLNCALLVHTHEMSTLCRCTEGSWRSCATAGRINATTQTGECHRTCALCLMSKQNSRQIPIGSDWEVLARELFAGKYSP